MTLVKIVNKKISLISKATKLLWESSPQNFFVLCILSIAMSLPEVAGLWVWKEILNFISLSLTGSEPMIEQICFYIFLHLCLKIIASLLNKLNTYNSNILKIMVDKEINKKYFNVVNGLLPQDIEVAEIRDKLEMIERDAGERTLGILMKMVELFQSISLLIFTSSVLAVIDFKIILVVLLSIIPISIAYKRTYKDIFIVYSERLEKLRYVKALRDTVHQNGFVMENMIYKVINYVETKSEELINEIIKSEKKLKKRVFIREALVENISMMLTYVVKLMLIILGISDNNNLGSIVMSISAFDKINNSILNVSMISNSLYDDGLYLKAINDLEEYAKKNSSNESRKQIINEVNKISFKNVFFRYQNSKSYSLKNISLNFEKGKSYAIVGKNGSGSSTTADAVMQLNAEDGGSRKYIMVQLPEKIEENKPAYKAGYKTIDEIGRARIEKAAQKIKKETGADIDYGYKLYYLESPSEKTLMDLENFVPENKLMTDDMVSVFDNKHSKGKESILATWLSEDGYGLSKSSKSYKLKNYVADLIEKTLYIIDEGLKQEDSMELIRRIENEELDITRLVVYVHSVPFNVLHELRKNLKVLRNNKNVTLIERF